MMTSGLGHQVASPAGLKEQFIPGNRILLLSFVLLSSTDLTPLPADPFPERTPALTPAAWGLQCLRVSPRCFSLDPSSAPGSISVPSPWGPLLPSLLLLAPG